MVFSELFPITLIPSIDQQITIIMFRSWLTKILLCFSQIHNNNRKNQEQHSSDPISSSSLEILIWPKVRCRRRAQFHDNKPVSSSLLQTSFKPQIIAGFLNESHNCSEISPYRYESANARCRQKSSLIAIDIDDDKFPLKQPLIESVRNRSTLTTSLYRSTLSVHKQKSDSIIFISRYWPTTNHRRSRQRTVSDYSPHNTNTITYDSSSSDTITSISSLNSDVHTPLNRTKDKTWRLQIHDDLNKDGSRHNVMHKGLLTKRT